MVLAILLAVQTAKVQTFDVQGTARLALVVAPRKSERPPLVFAFHGHGGSMRQAQRSFAIDKLWPEAIVVYPQGLPIAGRTDPEGKRDGWQKNAGEVGDRDLAFFDAMLAAMKRNYRIDERRIYAMGHSNGGRFTYLLWARRGKVFAAVGPSASPATGLIRDLEPLSAFLVAGRSDPLVPYFTTKFSIDAVRKLLGADPERARKDGYLAIEPAPNGLELATYVFPGGHQFQDKAAVAMVEFFRRHSRR